MTLTRLMCPPCAADTLHAGMKCVHCGHVLPVLISGAHERTYRQLSDGSRLSAQSMRRGGQRRHSSVAELQRLGSLK